MKNKLALGTCAKRVATPGRRGYSLVEILVVMAIIALLLSMILVSVYMINRYIRKTFGPYMTTQQSSLKVADVCRA